MQCGAVCCSVLQCVAVCCSVLQYKNDKMRGNRSVFRKRNVECVKKRLYFDVSLTSLSCNLCLSQLVFQMCVCLSTHVFLCVSDLHACLISMRVGSLCISQSLRWDTWLNLQTSKQSCNILSLSLFVISVFIHDWILNKTHFPCTELISHIQTKLQRHFSMSDHDIYLYSWLDHV